MTDELKRKCETCVITTLGQDEYIDCLEEQYEELEKENEQLKQIAHAVYNCSSCSCLDCANTDCVVNKY